MQKPSELTYSYIFLGIFGFTIGCVLALLRTKRINVKVRKGEPNYFLLKIACVIIIAYCLYRISLIVVFLAQGYSWGEIRLMHGIAGDSGEGTLKGGTFSQILHDWCVAPLLYLLAPTLVIDLFGYTGALKAPVRCFGNHLSEKRKSLFQTDNKCGGAAILKNRTSRMGTPVGC